jgi:hypothetical protein
MASDRQGEVNRPFNNFVKAPKIVTRHCSDCRIAKRQLKVSEEVCPPPP